MITVALLGLLACSLEGFLRLLGFGKPLLYIADDRIGYLLAPNQQTHRFGNRISINQYSMRSSEILSNRSPQTLRILLIGDSVANGGWWTDQSQIISEQIRSLLSANAAHPVEVLNASANSWSPHNELAYLQRFGTFEAQIVVVLLNTDDLFGAAPTSAPVGLDRHYPDRYPISALAAVLFRHQRAAPPSANTPADRVGFNLAAIEEIKTIVTGASGQLLLAMTPLWREIDPGSRDYELKARQQLETFVQTQQIPYADFLPIFRSIAQPKTLYRDHIHPSVAGNQVISRCLASQIQRLQE